MSVFSIAFVIARERHDGNTEVKPFMQVVTMMEPSTVTGAVEHLRSSFQETVHAKDGWHLQGDPVLFEYHQGLQQDWQPYMKPAPVPETSRDHLKVVK
jgi:hypothetical protein